MRGRAEALAEDESLRQPTRFWFDFAPRDDDKALLAGADMAALPMVDGTDAPEPVPELVDQNGRKAPEWYAHLGLHPALTQPEPCHLQPNLAPQHPHL